jgi:hypothetical protein
MKLFISVNIYSKQPTHNSVFTVTESIKWERDNNDYEYGCHTKLQCIC